MDVKRICKKHHPIAVEMYSAKLKKRNGGVFCGLEDKIRFRNSFYVKYVKSIINLNATTMASWKRCSVPYAGDRKKSAS